ncbi:hypothetical protein OBCHQ24_05985 [Oceanobacillus iheyensis]|nr:hypothetical protein OBCHQ24_05985 [Oceanobacillus iheyensis]
MNEVRRMYIEKATIYGFGTWVDKTIEFPKLGPVVIYGENESGKSTLQAFILFMLFGLPPKQRNFYKPRTSGKMGGRLTVIDPDTGRITIERLDTMRNGAALCYAENGAEYDETWLRSRLKGMTEQTYRSIFSFSASDLANLPKMKEEDLGEVLLGIGLTGSTAIHSLETSLESQINRLYKPSGKKPLINEQLSKLEARSNHLQSEKSHEATYREKKEKVLKLYNTIEETQQRLQKNKATLTLKERKLQVLPDLKNYASVLKQLEQFPEKVPFPENGMERMQQVKDKLLPIKSEHALLQENQKKYGETLSSLNENFKEVDGEKLQYAYKLRKQAEEYLAEKKEIINIQKQKEQIENQVEQELDQLHIDLNKELLHEINLPFHTEKTWSQLKTEQDTLAIEQSKHVEESHQLKKDRTRLLSQAESLEENLLSEERVKELKSKIHELNSNNTGTFSDSELRSDQNTWEKWKQKKKKTYQAVFFYSLGLAILLGVIGTIVETYTYYMFAGVSIIVGVLQWWSGKHALTEVEAFTNAKENTSVTMVEKREAEQQLLKHENVSTEIATLEAQLKSLDHTFAGWQERGEQLKNRQTLLNKKIENERQQYSFLLGINVIYWPDVYHHLKHLIRQSREENRLTETLNQLESKQQRFSQELKVFLSSFIKGTVDKTQEDLLTLLEEWIQGYEKNESQKLHYQQLYKETTEQLHSAEKKLSIYEAAHMELLQYAEVDGENAFYKRANLLAEKEQLQETSSRLEQLLQPFLHEENTYSLVTSEETEMVEHINREKQRITMLESDLENQRQLIADVKAELSQLESSGEYSEALHVFSMEKEEFQQSVRKWAVIKTAKEMLVETKRKYRDKYLARVMEKTNEYFQLLTGEKYQNVYAPVEGKVFQVETTDHVRFTVNELSQGTKDQLYISLRLAISEIMSEKHRLPFILDDAFVHFDSTRTERMFQLIKALSNKQQILLFTCNEDFIKYFELENIIQLKNSVRIN